MAPGQPIQDRLDAVGDGDARFEIRGTLGAGGMGIVYRAFDRRRGREVALKTLRQASGRELYRFKREFRALADIVHPNLVGLDELHTAGDEWFFTMELVEGVTFIQWVRDQDARGEPTVSLSAAITEPHDAAGGAPAPAPESIEGTLRPGRLEDALAQLVEGVLALHASGKLHRDLKPSNVLVTAEGRVVLLDFGLIFATGQRHLDLTHDRAAVGTPAYMSPEQAADEPLDEASDWYSVGVILYEALTGRRPFEGTAEAMMRRKQSEVPAAPHERAPGVPPVLSALCMRLLARSPSERADGHAILTALGRTPSRATLDLERAQSTGPFVGRRAELAALRRAYDDGREHGIAMFVRGDSGIGKSQLVRHFLDQLGDEPLVLEGRCYQRESVPYKTLDTLIDAVTGVLLRLSPDRLAAALPRDLAALARLFPVLRRVPLVEDRAAGAALPPDPQELRRRAFTALRTLLRSLAAIAPVVIAIDDLQWGDADSAVFLAELIHHPEPVPLLLVLLYRSGDDAGVVAQIAEPRAGLPRGDTRVLDVTPLGLDEAHQLVRALGGGTDTTSELLVREAGGHPLFLAELAHAASARADVASLEQLVERRVAALPAAAAALLRVVAAAARPVAVEQAARAAGTSDAGAAVRLLRAERLVRVHHRDDGAALEPYHDRIRAAALATLASGEVRHVHEALARTIEAAAGHGDGLVEHWLAAGDPARAAEHAVQAAQRAEDKLAFHRAAALYAVALEHGGSEPAVRRHLLTRRAAALRDAGALIEAATAFADAARDAPPDEALELDRLRLEQLLRSGRLAEGLELARGVLGRVGVRMASSTGAALRAAIVERIRIRFRGQDHVERAESAVDPATLRRLDTLYSCASGLAFIKPVVGRALQFKFLREALDAGEPHRIALAMSMELGYLGQAGVSSRPRIEDLVSRLSRVSARNQSPGMSAIATACEGLALFLMGRWRESRRLLASGGKELRDHATSLRWEISLADQYTTFAMFYLGETRELARLVPLLLAGAVERGDVYTQHGLRSARSNVAWLVMDRPEEARAQVAAVDLEAYDTGDDYHLLHYYQLLALTQADLYEGKAIEAWRRVDAGSRPLDRSYLLRIQNVRIETSFLRARAALACAMVSSPDQRPALIAEARRRIRGLEDEDAGWASGFAEQLRALVALVQDDRAGAEAHLEAAERIFARSDMSLHAAIMRLRLGQLAGGPVGAAWAAGARHRLRDEAIVDPDRMARMLCPWPAGLGDAG
jgi:eukaryotic-like serine/threonine-protein kinase